MHNFFKNIYLVLFFFCSGISVSAQLIDNTSTFKTIQQKSYFRFHYDNDYFTKADYYYSQGISFEYVNPVLKKNPLNKILIRPAGNDIKYGISLDLFGYTPTSILSDSILVGDRPYAAIIDARVFASATDSIHKRRISSALTIGVIGQAGLGFEIQNGIHRWLKNPLPHGWEYQIRNDLVLNYMLNYEKRLLDKPNHFSLNAVGEIRAGTLNNTLAAGFNFMAGNFNDPFRSKNTRKVEYYFYGQAKGNFIGYDASMQGGFFNRKSPYTIPTSDIERFTFQADAGIVVNFKRLYLSYSQSFLSSEFRTGMYHRWGGISIGFSL